MLLVTDLDETLLGDPEATSRLWEHPARRAGRLLVAAATGRCIDSTIECLLAHDLDPREFVALATSVGAEMYEAGGQRLVQEYTAPFAASWDRERVREALDCFDDLEPQLDEDQRPFKVSYYVSDSPDLRHKVESRFQALGVEAEAHFSLGVYLDVMPRGLHKGAAVRYLMSRLGFDQGQVMTAGDSNNDRGLFECGVAATIVANHCAELSRYRRENHVYFANATHATGILEGLEHFGLI